MAFTWRISSVADLETWASNTLDVDTDGARRVARAIWDRDDFPHPVNGTDLSDYLAELPEDWLAEQVG